ncbi:MAG: sulfatase-like hydrolase/transferase [Acidobacteria bacterium]|nr:sulfatase-like hydrolase/transferase [Acidobacteriota bacterium]
MERRSFLSSLAAAPLSAASARPNFVILFTDDQRFNTIRALGNREIQTPNMDRLAARGIAFTHACIMGGTQGAVCVPSRAMLMTGQTLFRAARNTGATPGDKATPEHFVMMPEHLGANGYKTFATGKWHNGPKLFARCFGNGGNIFFGGMGDQVKMPVQDFDPSGAYPKSAIHPAGKFTSELFADTAIEFLRGHKGPEPFFLYTAFTSPHDPRMAPKKYVDMYPPDKITLPPNFLPEHPFDNGELKVRDENLAPHPRTSEDTRRQIAEYYAMVTEVDHNIGRILDALDSSPHAKNTYVIFAGDNGLAVGQHGLFGKQNVYDHSVRVPLMISGPGIPKGKRSDAFTYHFDIYPTICKLAGLPVPEMVEGEDLAPLWKGQKKAVRDSVFFAYRNLQRAVRTRDWKLIRYTIAGKETIQLFHVARDPWETTNLAGKPEHADREKDLLAALAAWQKRVGDPLANA